MLTTNQTLLIPSTSISGSPDEGHHLIVPWLFTIGFTMEWSRTIIEVNNQSNLTLILPGWGPDEGGRGGGEGGAWGGG